MAIYNREDARTALPQLEKRLDSILDMFYPVGSFYDTTDENFNPNKSWGGTWEKIEDGRVLISADGNTYNVGDTGGAVSVTLGADEIPAHTHGSKTLDGYMYPLAWTGASGSGIVSVTNYMTNLTISTSGSSLGTFTYRINATHEHDSVGGGKSHSNMQPYLVVNRWHRIK